MSFRKPARVIVYLAVLILAGCDERRIPTAVESPSPEVPAPPSPPPPPAPPASVEARVLEVGKSVSGTISRTDGSCRFADWQSAWEGLCDAFEVTAPASGALHATVRWADANAPFAVFAKSSAGEQIDLACCASPVLMSLPVDSGLTYRIEIAYVGRPPGYPGISPVEYTIETVVQPIAPESVAPLSVSVLGDEAHTHHLSQARVEVIEGPSSGTVARFDEVSGLYVFERLQLGYVTLNLSAPGFVSSIRRVPVGTNMPLEIELQRREALANATSSLQGVTWVYTSRNSAWVGVKVEILDGPLAGIFTFSDEWFGMYNLAGLPAGVIHVRASAPWLLPQTLSVAVSGNTRLDFNMQQP